MTKGKRALTRWLAIVGATQLFLGLGLMATAVSADTLRISCTSPTVCTAGSVTQVAPGNSPTFNLTNQNGPLSGDAWLAILEPNVGAFTGGLTKGGVAVASEGIDTNLLFNSLNLAALLNEPTGPGFMNDYNFSNFVSAAAQAGVVAASFRVSEFGLGPYVSPGGGLVGISNLQASGLPKGTVIVAWVEGATFLDQTPLSGSLTSVPEPGILALFGSSLVGVCALVRRRLFNCAVNEAV